MKLYKFIDKNSGYCEINEIVVLATSIDEAKKLALNAIKKERCLDNKKVDPNGVKLDFEFNMDRPQVISTIIPE